jgi:hypothetical protein
MGIGVIVGSLPKILPRQAARNRISVIANNELNKFKELLFIFID